MVDIRELSRNQLDLGFLRSVSAWISRTGELPLISGESGTQLDLETLKVWVESAVCATAAVVGEEVIAFGTLSRAEAALEVGEVEVCHLIVHPDWRRRYKGSQLVLELAQRAREEGFLRTVGRVVPSNAAAQSLLASLRWTQLASAPLGASEFRWFGKELGA